MDIKGQSKNPPNPTERMNKAILGYSGSTRPLN